jgi:transmembrane sensor
LRVVLADLERYRGGRVVALDDRLAAARVTGVFALSDPDAALDVIGAALGMAVTRWPLLAVVRPA